jgi:ATP/maltotriose-dependent transcriptional regulator MalT
MNHLHHSGPNRTVLPSLSSRELQVLTLLSTGIPIKRVAQELDISAHTVNQHVRQIYLKLGVHNRITALNRARQLGLLVSDGVPPPQPTLSY